MSSFCFKFFVKTRLSQSEEAAVVTCSALAAHLCDLLVDLDAQRFHLDQREHPGVVLALAHPLVLRVLRPARQPLPYVGRVHHLHDPLPRCRREVLPVACLGHTDGGERVQRGQSDLWVTALSALSVFERIYSHLGARSGEEDVDGNENTTSAERLLF